MSDNTELLEQPNAGVEIPGEHQPEAVETQQPEQSDTETRARAMGWVPKDQFRGPPENWRDADEFVRRGEEELPILRERNRSMAREHAEMKARIERQEREFNERVQRQEGMARIALQRQRENIEAQYEAAMRGAVEMGDTQRYDQLTRDKDLALGHFDRQVYETVTPKHDPYQPEPLPPQVQAEVSVWTQQNPWFTADPVLNQYAQIVHMQLNREKPGMTLRENLEQVARDVRQRFPEKFGTVQQRPTAVEGSSGNGFSSGGAKRSKGYADLPAEAKRDVDEYIRAGAFKDRNEGAKAYWDHNAA